MQLFLSLKVCFSKKFHYRPVDEIVNNIYHPNFGIIFTNGETWKRQQNTFVRIMKDTGFKKSNLKSVIMEVWPRMKESLTDATTIVVGLNETSKPGNNITLEKIELAFMELFTLTFVDKNIFPGGDVPQDYLTKFNTYRICGEQWITANALWWKYPILRHLAPEFSGFVWIKNMIASTGEMLNELVSHHSRDGVSSYINSYLKKIDEAKDKIDKHNGWRALIASLEDYLKGADSLITAIYSLLYCLSRNPNVQEEMRKEIQEGSETYPYCKAVILETLRYVPQAGIGPKHYSDEDIFLDGFKIPAKMGIYLNVLGIVKSERYWEKPEVFNPMRFIGQDGNLVHPKAWIPFSIGNRACPAKSMSKDVMLMLGMKIVSEMELSFSGFVNETANELEYAGMMLVYMQPFKMRVEELSEERKLAIALQEMD